MALSYVTSAEVMGGLNGFGDDASGTFDAGTGSDRVLLVWVVYENGANVSVSGITYDGASMSFVDSVTVSAGDNFSETIEVWALAGPSSGANTLQLTNTVGGSQDASVVASVYSGADQTTPTDLTASEANPLSNDGETSISIDSGNAVAWAVVQDRATVTFTPATDNTLRTTVEYGTSAGGLTFGVGDRLTGSGSVTVGATGDNSQDIAVLAVELVSAAGGGGAAMPMAMNHYRQRRGM